MKNESAKTHLTEKKCGGLFDRKKRLQSIKEAAARNKRKNQWLGEIIDDPVSSKAEEKGTDLLPSRLREELTVKSEYEHI